MRGIAERRRDEVDAALEALDLQRRVDARAAAGEPVTSLEELGVGPPESESYRLLLRDGRVLAVAYEASSCEQRLQRALDAWEVEHPDETPSLDALGVDVPDYLVAAEKNGEVRVRPR